MGEGVTVGVGVNVGMGVKVAGWKGVWEGCSVIVVVGVREFVGEEVALGVDAFIELKKARLRASASPCQKKTKREKRMAIAPRLRRSTSLFVFTITG